MADTAELTPDAAIALLKSIVLPPPPPPEEETTYAPTLGKHIGKPDLPPQEKINEPVVQISNNQSMIIYDPNLAGEDVEVCQNSILLAQMHADNMARMKENTDKWYDEFLKICRGCGFVSHGLKFSYYKSEEATFKLDATAVKILANLMSGNKAAAIQSALDKLKEFAEKGDLAVNMFGKSEQDTKEANFMMGYVEPHAQGPVVNISAFSMTATKTIRDIFFSLWKMRAQDLKVYTASDSMQMNLDHYKKRAKKLVEDKLYEETYNRLATIKIPRPVS